MRTEFVSTARKPLLIEEVRASLDWAESALLLSAFVHEAGIHLIQSQLARLGGRARILTTTVFGSTSPAALNRAAEMGAQVRIFNASSGSYHPKLYLALRGAEAKMVVGSANLTRGLVANTEVGALLSGVLEQPAIADACSLAEELWKSSRAIPWQKPSATERERFHESELYDAIRSEVARDPSFRTLGNAPKSNIVREVTPFGLYVETDRTRAQHQPPQLVPAWMIELAYSYLIEHGALSNAYLIANDGLNVKRSSFVCALLARLPGIRVRTGGPITLEWKPHDLELGLSLAADRGATKK